MASKDIRAAKRYATALFHAAVHADNLTKVETDLSNLLKWMQESPVLRQYWESPLVPSGRKREQITTVLGESVEDLTLSFLRLLIDKRREDILDAVDFELRQHADTSRHIIRAEATFALAPTDAEKQSLIKSLAQRTGENVELTVSVDANILGGVVVRLHDTIIDGSVRGTLERVREQLLHEA